MTKGLVCGECLLRGVYMPLRMTEPPTCPVCGSRKFMLRQEPSDADVRYVDGCFRIDVLTPKTAASTPRTHLVSDAKTEGAYTEPWCPATMTAADPLFMSRTVASVTCLECLNLALDQAIRDNDSVIAAALIDRRKLLPNYKARKAARGEAYHATKVPQPIVMSNWPGLQQTAKRSHEQMREIAMNQVDAAASNFSTRRMAADILYLLEESEALQLELAQAQMNLANEKMMRATDPFAARIAGMSLGVEFDSRAASQAGLPFVTSVRNCSRCKGGHDRISFRRILNPDDRGNWYAICPMTEQPILLVAKHRA